MRTKLPVLAIGVLLCAGPLVGQSGRKPTENLRQLLKPGSEWTYDLTLGQAKGPESPQFAGWVTQVGFNFLKHAEAANGSAETELTFAVAEGKAQIPEGRKEVFAAAARIPIRIKGISRHPSLQSERFAPNRSAPNLGLYSNVSEDSLCWIILESSEGSCLLADEATWQEGKASLPDWRERGEETPLASVRFWSFVPSNAGTTGQRTLEWDREVRLKGTDSLEQYVKVYGEPEKETVETKAGRFEQCTVTTIHYFWKWSEQKTFRWQEKSWFKPGIGIVKWVQTSDDGASLVSLSLSRYRLGDVLTD